MKFILNTNTIFCFLMSLIYVIFPIVIVGSKPTEESQDVANAVLPLSRMLGFTLAAMAFLSLISVRFLTNRASVLTALFTLTIFHGGLLLTSGLAAVKGTMLSPVPVSHGILFLAFVYLLYTNLRNGGV
ncbi:MAG: hypothetical protein SGJ10_04175 [Bacteroidota bacterium]|nr:hypothetical protein [Bacteroidota bacterium]